MKSLLNSKMIKNNQNSKIPKKNRVFFNKKKTHQLYLGIALSRVVFRGWECSQSIRDEILLRSWWSDFFSTTFSKIYISIDKKKSMEKISMEFFFRWKFCIEKLLTRKNFKSKKKNPSKKISNEKFSTQIFFDPHFFWILEKLKKIRTSRSR